MKRLTLAERNSGYREGLWRRIAGHKRRIANRLGKLNFISGSEDLARKMSAAAADKLVSQRGTWKCGFEEGVTKVCCNEFCLHVGEALPLSEFGFNSARKDGRNVYCKDCNPENMPTYAACANSKAFPIAFLEVAEQIPNPNEPLTIKKGA